MPRYDTLADIPDQFVISTWKMLNERLTGYQEQEDGSFIRVPALEETKFIKGALRHDIPALRPGDSPLLVTIKAADDWQRMTVGIKPVYNWWGDFALRLYVYDEGGTVEQIQTRYDQIENANAVLLRVLRSPYMVCHAPYWDELELVGGRPNSRTAVIGKEKERLFITTRIRVRREFRPGQ